MEANYGRYIVYWSRCSSIPQAGVHTHCVNTVGIRPRHLPSARVRATGEKGWDNYPVRS